MFDFLFKKRPPVMPEPELTDIGQIVWFNPGKGHDRVPFVLTQIRYGIDGYDVQFTAKSELDRTHLWCGVEG